MGRGLKGKPTPLILETQLPHTFSLYRLDPLPHSSLGCSWSLLRPRASILSSQVAPLWHLPGCSCSSFRFSN